MAAVAAGGEVDDALARERAAIMRIRAPAIAARKIGGTGARERAVSMDEARSTHGGSVAARRQRKLAAVRGASVRAG